MPIHDDDDDDDEVDSGQMPTLEISDFVEDSF
jgi:hypothetical protein